MDIAFFGSSLVSAYWNGAATYYRGLIRALHARGHRVTFYEPDAYSRQQHRDIPDPPWANVVVYGAEGEDAVRACLDEAGDADVIVKASGVGVFDGLLEQAVLDLKRSNNLVIFWDVDAPATLERVRATPIDPFAALIPQYDLILTYSGGDPVVAAYESLGARRCVPIYNALDPTMHHPVAPDPRFAGDLGFLGNRLPDREARVEEFFLKPAAMLPDRKLLIGGNGTEILVAASGDEVAERVSSLSIAETRKIGQAALKRVLAEHTYDHRAKLVEATLNGAVGSAPRTALATAT